MSVEEFGGGASGDPNEPNPNASPSGDKSTGKHLILMVPDFKAGQGAPMCSYLRLGDAHSQAGPRVTGGSDPHDVRTDLGEDLASLVTGFTDDTRQRNGGADAGDSSAKESLSIPPAVAADPSPPSLTIDQRRAESQILHRKGGWRDHSDGNRITTTRGDKVEVIRGNYKMLVLGRSDPPTGNMTGVEIAGGNIDWSSEDLSQSLDGDPTSVQTALQTTFEWFKGSDGRWGWKQTTKSGHPEQPNGNNGQIITKTWADLIETDQGSDGHPVTTITSNTYATTVTSMTSVSSIDTRVTASNSVNNDTRSPVVTTYTEAGMQISAELVGGNIITNVLGASLELDIAGAIAVVQVAGALASIQAGAAIFNGQSAGVTIVTESEAPTMVNTMTGVSIDTHAGLHVDNHPGVHLDFHNGSHVDIHSGTHFTFDSSPNPTTITPGQAINVQGMTATLNSGGDVTVGSAQSVRIATTHVTL